MPTGNIRKRSKDSYEISFEDGRDAQGKRVRRCETAKSTRKDAERRLNELRPAVTESVVSSQLNHQLTPWLKQNMVIIQFNIKLKQKT